MSSHNILIVPYDFTAVGDTALKYALFISSSFKAKIILLHIMDGKGNEGNLMSKLESVIEKFGPENKSSTPIEPKVIKGSIFEDITKFATENDARLIVMGTHGAQGFQKVFGSYAMKVVTNTNIPFLVVQEGASNYQLKNIVLPITFEKESLQILTMSISLALAFDAKIHIIAQNRTDTGLLQRIKIRMNLVEKQFEEFNVKHEYHFIKDRSFHRGIINYAKENNCDIIGISHYTDSIIPQLDRFTQGLITNAEKIPCLVINAKLMEKFYF